MKRLLEQSLRELVACNSVSSTQEHLDQSNRNMIDLLAQWFSELGWRIQILESPSATSVKKWNLLASIGPEEADQPFLFHGHTDTVPAQTNAWKDDPWRLRIQDGRWVGLGSADMKGFFAALRVSSKQLGLPLRHLKRRITLVASADEETTMNGMRSLLHHSALVGSFGVVVGEPDPADSCGSP